eukprot:2603585-Amphidinium_carterae.3
MQYLPCMGETTTKISNLKTSSVWLDGQPTLHAIDEATRYSQAVFLPSQNEVVIMEKLSELWIKVFGPRRHAGIVERHHEILRSSYHRIRDQPVADVTCVSADIMLSELSASVHARKTLTVSHHMKQCVAEHHQH